MAMSRGQRIGMWAVLVLMVLGTLASFFGMILASDNTREENEQQQKALEAYQKQLAEADKMAIKHGESSKPFDPAYAAEVFRAGDITELQKTDLVEGTGAVAEKGQTITVSYFGWNAEGKIFDSTLQDGQENKPADLNLVGGQGGVIAGWVEGLPGMKVGGVRKLAIPADKAYGPNRQSPLIGAKAPLMFIIRLEAVK